MIRQQQEKNETKKMTLREMHEAIHGEKGEFGCLYNEDDDYYDDDDADCFCD